MIIFQVAEDRSALGRKVITAENAELVRCELRLLLARAVITDATVTVTSDLSTVGIPTVSNDEKSVTFLVTTTSTEEVFTLTLQVETSDGQVFNFTIVFDVRTPLSVTS